MAMEGNMLRKISTHIESPYDVATGKKILFSRGSGGFLFDNQGNQYIDLMNGKGSIILGHNNVSVNNRIMQVLSQNQNCLTGPANYIEELTEIILSDHKFIDEARISYFSSGTAACRAVACMARKITNKEIILSSGYHGWDTMWATKDYLIMNNQGVIDFYFVPELLEMLINKYNGKIALIIFSPDYIYLEDNTLDRILQLAKENNILVCCDDVKQGYRYNCGNSIELASEIRADIYTYSKGLSNGQRFSCVVGRKELMNGMKHFSYTNFYDVVPFAAGCETLMIMRSNNGYAHIRDMGNRIVLSLNKLFALEKVPVLLCGNGPMFQFVFGDEKWEKAFYKYALREGIILYEGDNQAVSFAFNTDVINMLEEKIKIVIEKLKQIELDDCSITSKRLFFTAWNMIDGAADVGTLNDKIKWIQEILQT